MVAGYGLDNRGVGVRAPARVKSFSLLRSVQTGSEAYQPPIPLVTGTLSPGGKAAGT
jgi:hypothetical protein